MYIEIVCPLPFSQTRFNKLLLMITKIFILKTKNERKNEQIRTFPPVLGPVSGTSRGLESRPEESSDLNIVKHTVVFITIYRSNDSIGTRLFRNRISREIIASALSSTSVGNSLLTVTIYMYNMSGRSRLSRRNVENLKKTTKHCLDS